MNTTLVGGIIRDQTGKVLYPKYYAAHITTNTTTTPTTATAYITAIWVTVTAIGTTEQLVIRNKEGTPKVLYQQGSPLVAGSYPNSVISPIIATNGIDIITSGSAAATIDVFVTYWQ